MTPDASYSMNTRTPSSAARPLAAVLAFSASAFACRARSSLSVLCVAPHCGISSGSSPPTRRRRRRHAATAPPLVAATWSAKAAAPRGQRRRRGSCWGSLYAATEARFYRPSRRWAA